MANEVVCCSQVLQVALKRLPGWSEFSWLTSASASGNMVGAWQIRALLRHFTTETTMADYIDHLRTNGDLFLPPATPARRPAKTQVLGLRIVLIAVIVFILGLIGLVA